MVDSKTKAKTTAESTAEKPKRRGFFRTLSSVFFDVPRWVNAKQYIETNKTLFTRIKDVFRIAKAQRHETFDAAMQRLQVSDQDLKERLQSNQRAMMIILLFVAILCVYGIILMFKGTVAGVVVVLAIIALSAVRAFQYSFWNFQIKNRKLGCSFKEWWSGKSDQPTS